MTWTKTLKLPTICTGCIYIHVKYLIKLATGEADTTEHGTLEECMIRQLESSMNEIPVVGMHISASLKLATL